MPNYYFRPESPRALVVTIPNGPNGPDLSGFDEHVVKCATDICVARNEHELVAFTDDRSGDEFVGCRSCVSVDAYVVGRVHLFDEIFIKLVRLGRLPQDHAMKHVDDYDGDTPAMNMTNDAPRTVTPSSLSPKVRFDTDCVALITIYMTVLYAG